MWAASAGGARDPGHIVPDQGIPSDLSDWAVLHRCQKRGRSFCRRPRARSTHRARQSSRWRRSTQAPCSRSWMKSCTATNWSSAALSRATAQAHPMQRCPGALLRDAPRVAGPCIFLPCTYSIFLPSIFLPPSHRLTMIVIGTRSSSSCVLLYSPKANWGSRCGTRHGLGFRV